MEQRTDKPVTEWPTCLLGLAPQYEAANRRPKIPLRDALTFDPTRFGHLQESDYEMDCVNLKERFGDRYKVEYEESYYADHGDRARAEEPWLMTIPCRHGHLYPHGGNLLGVSTNTKGLTTKRIRDLVCTTVVQDSDGGVNATFLIQDFDQVAEMMRPHRRRQWTDKQREDTGNRLAEYQFRPVVSASPDEQTDDPIGAGVSFDPMATPGP